MKFSLITNFVSGTQIIKSFTILTIQIAITDMKFAAYVCRFIPPQGFIGNATMVYTDGIWGNNTSFSSVFLSKSRGVTDIIWTSIQLYLSDSHKQCKDFGTQELSVSS